MKKFLILLVITGLALSVECQNYTKEKRLIDKKVAKYIKEGQLVAASNLMVDYAIEMERQGDTLLALQYQLENCHLIDDHIDFFRKAGLTPEMYFANWYASISLEGWLKMKNEGAIHLFSLLRKMQKEAPDLLPFYASTLAYIIEDFRDPGYKDSIYLLQSALDVIKAMPITKNTVQQYIRINECFMRNRFYNSFDGVIFTKNRLPEICDWYAVNSPFIHNLDTSVYCSEILQYDFDYADLLYGFASSSSAQDNDPIMAINLYEKEIAVLKPLLKISNKPALKIAACYAQISLEYYLLGDNVRCKEYNDQAIVYLYDFENDSKKSEIDNFVFFEIYEAIAFNYFIIGNISSAAQIEQMAILTKEQMGWNCSQSNWASYFMYVLNDDPHKILQYKDKAINADKKYGESYSLFLDIGKAYSMLMDETIGYKDSAEVYFHNAESIVNTNILYYDEIGELNDAKSNIQEAWAGHFMRLNKIRLSYDYSKKALNLTNAPTYINFCNVSLKAALLHDIEGIHKYLPKFYYDMEDELGKMLPTLGSIESDLYLGNGEGTLYNIPEWASWNPTDSVSVSIAYDAALLMKGLTLRYNVLSPYFENHPEMVSAKLELDKMRDSIYAISDDNARVLALYRYELKEREILSEINHEFGNIHWRDVAQGLKKDEACIEFVKYTVNSYSWCDSAPKPHYSAMVLLPNDRVPVFVDLFDEDDLLEVYELQPKSYNIEIGQMLYSKIWGKMQRYIEGKDRVFFSPMGLLNLINIELLTDSTGRTATERFNLYRVSSTRNIIKKNRNRDIHFVESFGGVDYENAQEYAEMMRSINSRGNWKYLQNTLLEVNQIKNLLKDSGVDVATYTGPRATESAFKQLDGTQADIIHIATHGYYIPQSQRSAIPYFARSENTESIQDELFYSGLILSGGQKAWNDSTFKPDNNDGILTAYEISKLDLHNVNLVVLSACETGLGDDLFDGIFGLQRAFKKAGAGAILMSLWQIDDKATSEYMSLFYEKLVEGYSKHDAYISTVLLLKEKYPDATYWASFVLLD
jgi:hypothetical protein